MLAQASLPELNNYIRIFLMSSSVNGLYAYLLFQLFPSKRYPKLLFFGLFLRFAIDFYLTNIYSIGAPLSDRGWYVLCIYILNITTYLSFAVCLRYPAIRVIGASIILDVLASIIGIAALIIINLVEGQSSIAIYSAPFQPLDLLFPILIIPTGVILCWLCRSYMALFRNYQFKHPRIMVVIMVSYVILAFATRINDLQAIPAIILVGFIYILIYIFALLGPALMGLTNARNQQSYLAAQQKLMESYLTAAKEQTYTLKKTQQLINTQMEELVHADASAKDNAVLAGYLAELKEHYVHIQTGMYSNNWMVDAAISTQAEQLQEQQIDFDCSMVGYHSETIDDWDLVQLILFLLDYGKQANQTVAPANRKISLVASTVKNALILDFTTSCSASIVVPKQELRKHLKKYNGYMQVTEERSTLKISCSLIAKE